MPRIFLPVENPQETIRIIGEKAHYVATVLRCRTGDILTVFNGRGVSYKTIIANITKKEVVSEVVSITKGGAEPSLNLTLIQGLLKGDKMDLVIQKTTELGISRVIPVVTERSQVRSTGKTVRWRKIAEEASRQSGRVNVPVICEPLFFEALFSLDNHHGLPDMVSSLIFWEDGGIRLQDSLESIGRTDRPFALAVGPEGGFREDEVRMAVARGFTTVSLGNRILRAETAAITAVAIMQFSLGGLG